MKGKVLSYSAGSSSLDPYKFRVIDQSGPSTKMSTLVSLFPELQRFFVDPSQTLVVDAYPAALGGMESMTRVFTYLHPPTCTRALRLAASENLQVVFIAQPLAGAELLMQAMDSEMDWPAELLWATGGYPLPASLERSLAYSLAERGCRMSVLQAYGVAELDHTLLASMHRDEQSRPIYQWVDPDLELTRENRERYGLTGSTESSVGPTETLVGPTETLTGPTGSLTYRGVPVPNDDRIEATQAGYRIHGNASLYPDDVLQWLEQWEPSDWRRYTGYLFASEKSIYLQRRDRELVSIPIGSKTLSEPARTALPKQVPCTPVGHFDFMARYRMSWMEKPKWNAEVFRQLGARPLAMSNARVVAA